MRTQKAKIATAAVVTARNDSEGFARTSFMILDFSGAQAATDAGRTKFACVGIRRVASALLRVLAAWKYNGAFRLSHLPHSEKTQKQGSCDS